MRYTIVSRNDPLSKQVEKSLDERLTRVNSIRDDYNPEVVITVGGDGTVLEAVHNYLDRLEKVVFVGIHTGKLGFYADYIYDDIDTFIQNVISNKYNDVSFPLLSATIYYQDREEHYLALNEFTLINPYRTQHLDVYINDEYFESFQGTGLCISTPTGSSAFNKSLGGALIHPHIKAFQLTEIASINSNVYRTISSPLIFPKEHFITLKSTSYSDIIFTIDHKNNTLKNYQLFKFQLSDKEVRFRHYNNNDFWRRVKKSFLPENM